MAVGDPVSDATLTVVDGALRVRPTGGSGYYSTIQSAVDASTNPSTILVYPNADFSAATYTENVTLSAGQHNRTIQSVCGADLTTVTSATTGNTVYALRATNFVVDGFEITGATGSNARGIYVNCDQSYCTGETVLKNNKIHGNLTGIYFNSTYNSPARIQNSEIYGNTDAMWLRAVNYIVNKRLFPAGASQ